MPYTPNAVVANSFSFPDYTFTMNVSGAVVQADVGKAVTLDTATANTVKLAAAGDRIYGRLESLETGGLDGLTVGAVSRKYRAILPVASGLAGLDVPAIGDTVVGSATAGAVKASNNATIKTPDRGINTVLEVLSGNRVVVEQL